MQAATLTAEKYKIGEANMLKSQNETSLPSVQVQFLRAAVDLLLTCRKTLAYTYVCAYYMKRDTPIQQNELQLFDDRQTYLASAVERLTDLVEVIA